jgi:hypothetical protein
VAAFVVSANVIPARASQLAVERLIIIACYDDAVPLGQQSDDRGLHFVEVLEFINEHELVRGHEGAIGVESLVRAIYTVIEVNCTVKIRSRGVEAIVYRRAIQMTHQFDELGSLCFLLQPLPVLLDERDKARVADEVRF